ncbi:hypothetical protein RHS04_01267 [Rhizoctonia solani]|uniref:Uncharacterized protein n=1 Tax=Rhizoctonia solani TaxID=456999 RepID=A0A8H7HH58_9AGAM|nr:hypothetical protein RHS04_01267 [Rhizoctonia solani]
MLCYVATYDAESAYVLVPPSQVHKLQISFFNGALCPRPTTCPDAPRAFLSGSFSLARGPQLGSIWNILAEFDPWDRCARVLYAWPLFARSLLGFFSDGDGNIDVDGQVRR